jgi:hypothetical protein
LKLSDRQLLKTKKIAQDMQNQIKVAIAGLGEFGSQITKWILAGGMQGICAAYCIDPDKTKRINDLPCYGSLEEVPEKLLSETDVIVDCSSKGQGISNIESYRRYGIPAVFQNGEDVNLCGLFSAETSACPESRYLKVARCSALSTCAAARPIMSITRVRDIWACHFKINMRDAMLTMDYISGKEIAILLGIPARVDVVYLRGSSYNGYAYHGFVHLECESAPLRDDVLRALGQSRNLELVRQGIDTRTHHRTARTLAIEESVEVKGSVVRLAVLSFTPEINFPQNEAAIRLLAQR